MYKVTDVRICGVAGGSLIRISKNKTIMDVGPRSSHIAGLTYSCFAKPDDLDNGEIIRVSPLNDDPCDYLCIRTPGGKMYGITNTCAANALNLVPENDNAFGNTKSAKIAFMKLSQYMNIPYEQIAKNVLDTSVTKIADYVTPMIKEYKLNKNRIVIIGGGGGSSVLVPFLTQKLGHQYKKAEHADIISSIGVATGMIYEERERTINNPTSEDLTELVNEVKNEAILKNASPESLSVQSEYLNERSILRVTVIGNVMLDLAGISAKEIEQNELVKIANELTNSKENLILEHKIGNYYIFSNTYLQKRLLFKIKKQSILVLDKFGRLRLSLDDGKIVKGNSKELSNNLPKVISNFSSNSGISPHIQLIDGFQILDFSSLNSTEQIIKSIREQINKINSDVFLIVKQ